MNKKKAESFGKDKALISAELEPRREMRDVLVELKIDDRLQGWIRWMQDFYEREDCVVGVESLFKNNAPFKTHYQIQKNYGINWNLFVVLCSLPVQRPRYLHTQRGRDLLYSIFYRCETNPSEHFDLIDVESTPYERPTKREKGNSIWMHKLILKSKSTGEISQVGWENFAQTRQEWLIAMLHKAGRQELKRYLFEGAPPRYLPHSMRTPLNLQEFLDERVTGKCNVTGQAIYYHRCFGAIGGSLDSKKYLASLDKLDSDEGYTLQNTWPVSWGWNYFKSNHSQEEAEELLLYLAEGIEKKNEN